MIFNRHIHSFIFSAACLLMLQGCFTGIESTPKISDNDVQKSVAIPLILQEDTILQHVVGHPYSKWHTGKRFIVTDTRFSKLLTPATTSRIPIALHDTIKLLYADVSATYTGKNTLRLTFDHHTIDTVDIILSLPDTIQPHIRIPFAVEQSIIDKTNSILSGRDFYITTSKWHDPITSQPIEGHKFSKCTIDSVTAGNAYYSATLHLHEQISHKCFTLPVALPGDARNLRTFSDLFRLEDPRLKYPHITDANWARIMNGQVVAEMTRDECRLALGTPSDVDRNAGYSTVRETWVYPNGVFLVFEDGLLKTFRQ